MMRSAMAIVDDVLKAVPANAHSLPRPDRLKRTANRVCKAMRPEDPKDLTFKVAIFLFMCEAFSKYNIGLPPLSCERKELKEVSLTICVKTHASFAVIDIIIGLCFGTSSRTCL